MVYAHGRWRRSGSFMPRFGTPRGHVTTRPSARFAVLLAVFGVALLPLVAHAVEVHVVQPGETLSDIAARYSKTVAEIADDNGIEDPDLIFAGQTLQLSSTGPPASGVRYVVQPFDTLSEIARQHGTTTASIVEANGLSDPDHIVVGQELVLSASGPVRATPITAETALENAEIEFGLPTGLLRGLSWQESGWQQNAVSPAGAVGVMQLLPSTAEWVLEFLLGEDLNWYLSAHDNARVGASFLRYLIERADGDVWWAIAAYYQGWGSLEHFGAFDDTVQYVENVLFLASQYE